MTQELVIGVLLTALVGLIWAMTMSLWTDRSARVSKTETLTGAPSDNRAGQKQSMAA